MKFELDTNAKTVKLLEDATLSEINTVLEKILDEDAKTYRIITNVMNYNPVVINKPYEIRPWPYWWQHPVTVLTTSGSTTQFLCESGTTSDTLVITNLNN